MTRRKAYILIFLDWQIVVISIAALVANAQGLKLPDPIVELPPAEPPPVVRPAPDPVPRRVVVSPEAKAALRNLINKALVLASEIPRNPQPLIAQSNLPPIPPQPDQPPPRPEPPPSATPVKPGPPPTTAPVKPSLPPPAAQENPAPVVVPPVDTEPSRPMIVLTDKYGADCPRIGRVGEILVLRSDKCQNYKLLKFDLSPYVPYDYDKLSHKLIFSVVDSGLYSVTVVATSPDGGLATEVYQIQFGEVKQPEEARAPDEPQVKKVRYLEFVFNRAKDLHIKANLLNSLASAFSSAAGYVGTGGVRSKKELVDNTDQAIDSLLTEAQRTQVKPLLVSILNEVAQEPDDMDRLERVWRDIQAGMERAAK